MLDGTARPYDRRVPDHPASPAGANSTTPRRELRGRVVRYAAGSVVATVCSEVAFLLLYGLVQASPAAASILAWLAGAVPNYWLNRNWTWKRRGRPSLTGELLPYMGIILATLLAATVATTLVDRALESASTSSGVRVALVGGTFLASYGVVFVLRFFLLDKLFGRALDPAAVGLGPGSAKERV